MNSSSFNAYKIRYRSAIRRVLADSEKGRLDEAGFAAYSHRSPIINWLFWRRLHIAMNYIEKSAPYETILDFGCGSGVMLPFLAEQSQRVAAFDVDLYPLERVKQHIPLAANVQAADANQTPISSLPSRSFDLINALDVLEHVQDLPQTLSQLMNLLKPNGQLVVSGPTENFLYKIGRKIAGPEYSGAYHERGIAEIKNELKRIARVEHIATLYQPVPLFEVFVAFNRPAGL
ncbi:MAG: class I SAM-dependent methyltransferase [Anaerolineales bacterium]|nr:class I SAM-dependent methyltransferase [Anaerolineales bacterium]MCL4261230.1 methyltransferase domain-containing protein [Anaerolineales bacterium]